MKKCSIALLDVLGWSGIWKRNVDAIKSLKTIIDSIDLMDGQFFAGVEELEQLKSKVTNEYRSISDSIALITYGECTNAIEYQSLIIGHMITESIKRGIPIRGAITYGEMYIEDNIMVGPAVDEVASWYESMDSIGVFLTPSSLFQLNKTDLHISDILVENNAPIKGFGQYKTLMINWPTIWKMDSKLGEEDLVNCFLKMGPITPSIAQKYMSSLDFFRSPLGQ